MDDDDYQQTLIISSELRLPDQIFDIDSTNLMLQSGQPVPQARGIFMQQNDQPVPEARGIFMRQNEMYDEQHENTKKHWIKQEIELFPEENIWTKRNVSCFINELDDFKKVPRRSYIQTFDNGIRTSIFHFADQDEPRFYISVYVSFAIHVYASVFWVFAKWTKKEKKCYSFLRSRNRFRTKPKFQLHYFFELKINKLSPGTGAILLNKPLMCTGIYDYSNIFNFFAKRLVENDLNHNDDTEFLFEYYHIFYHSKCKAVSCLKDLKNNLKGYLQLNIEECTWKKKLCKILYNEKMHYIQSGIYISTFAESLLKDNNNIVKGLLIDTTWKVMPG